MITNKLIQKRGKLLVSLLFFFCFNLSSQNRVEVKIIDCITNNELKECIIYSNKGEFLGITNNEGKCSFNYNKQTENQLVSIQKYEYKSIEVDLDLGINNICLEKLSVNISPIEISSSFDIKKYFLKLIKKTKQKGLLFNDTLYFDFEYTMEVPDSNWIEQLSGVIALPRRSIEKKYFQKAYYTQYSHNIDSMFLNSRFYKSCPVNIMTPYINWVGGVLYKQRKIEKFIKNRQNNFLINNELNSDSLIAIQFFKNKKIDYQSTFIFNRKDSCLEKIIRFSVPNVEFKIRNNYLKSSFSEVRFFSSNYIKMDFLHLQNKYINQGTIINIKFKMKLINGKEEIALNKSLPLKKVMMVSILENIKIIERNMID